MLAYLAGAFINAWIMSRFKVITRGKGFSGRAIVSTVFGEGIDSAIFITVAFAGFIPLNSLLTMVVTQALIKTAFEIILLPLTIRIVKKIKKRENTDAFDFSVSYNPFNLKGI